MMMTTRLFFLTFLLANLSAIAACDRSADDGPTVDKPLTAATTATEKRAALDLLNADDIESHVVYLADDALEGRMAGEAGYDAAAKYVADQFAAMGLEPGGVDGWYQQVPLLSSMIDVDSTVAIVHRDGVDTPLVYRDDYAMSGDMLRAATTVRAEVVYAGYGVHAPELGYSDYEGVDVDGKIVALFSGGPASIPSEERAYYSSSSVKYEEAVARGAVGTIGLRSRFSQASYPWDRIAKLTGTKPARTWVDAAGNAADYYPELLGDALISPAAATDLFANAPISFEAALDAIEATTPASVALGLEVTLARRTEHERLQSPNVIGVVRGTDPDLANEYVVYSAHLDHVGRGVPVDGDDIYNGMYDNALGTAIMIETARAIMANPPRRSVMFIAVTAEESGLLGSEYFAHDPTVSPGSMVANVNLDMPLFLFPLADLIAFGAEHSTLLGITEASANAEGFELTPDPIPEENLFIRSDQYSFVKIGVPAIFLVPGFGSTDPAVDGKTVETEHRRNHYHRPSDDLSRPVDWDSAVRFTRANTRIGLAVANADKRPTWNEDDFFGDMFARDR